MGALQSKPWGEGESTATVEGVLKWARTGDIILFAGKGGASDIIRCTSQARLWSHVGVVVQIGGVLHVTEAYKDVITTDAIRGDRHAGVQTVPLEERLRTYEGGRVAWRPVRHTRGYPVPQACVDAFVQRMRDYPADRVPRYCSTWRLWDLVEYATRTDDDTDRDATGREFYVCTSWTAEVWRMFGIYPPRQLLLADVGCFAGPTLNKGWVCGDVVYIVQ